jgi:hypothetical protein
MAAKEKARYNAANMKNLPDKTFCDLYKQKGSTITFFGESKELKEMEDRAKKLKLAK